MVQRWCFWGWSSGGVIGLGLIFHKKMSLQQSWRNVNLESSHTPAKKIQENGLRKPWKFMRKKDLKLKNIIA